MQTKALFFALLFSFSLAAADGVNPDACTDRPIVEADLDAANQMAAAIGHTEFEFSVPLGDGVTITHYGCCPWAEDSFIEMLNNVRQGILPNAEWENYNLTANEVLQLMNRIIVSIEPNGGPYSHFNRVLSDNNLKKM